jgi:BCD family chlorophyll transporter-like MFS transporter
MRQFFATDAAAFGAVFTFEAVLFLVAALMAARVIERPAPQISPTFVPGE